MFNTARINEARKALATAYIAAEAYYQRYGQYSDVLTGALIAASAALSRFTHP